MGGALCPGARCNNGCCVTPGRALAGLFLHERRHVNENLCVCTRGLLCKTAGRAWCLGGVGAPHISCRVAREGFLARVGCVYVGSSVSQGAAAGVTWGGGLCAKFKTLEFSFRPCSG